MFRTYGRIFRQNAIILNRNTRNTLDTHIPSTGLNNEHPKNRRNVRLCNVRHLTKNRS